MVESVDFIPYLRRIPPQKGGGRRATTTTPSDSNDVPPGQRNDFLFRLGASLRRAGLDQDEIEAALRERNSKFSAPLDKDEVRRIAASDARYDKPADIQAALNSERPKVLLAGAERRLADVATELGQHLRTLGAPIYVRNRDVVMVEGNKDQLLSMQCFRTLVERHVDCLRAYESGLRIHSMTESEASAYLDSPQFKEQLRPLRRIHTCRLPAKRKDRRIELLPEGYDEETATLTISALKYDDRMSFKRARAVINDLFREFEFADGKRSLAVAVSALMGMFAEPILEQPTSRPPFIIDKNSEGAGATKLVECLIGPVHGFPITLEAYSKDEAEMKKTTVSVVRENRPYLVFDNVKEVIGGDTIEAFTTALAWGGRLLGVMKTGSYPNNTTVFFTANGARTTPDMFRRSLVIELHQEYERPSDRQYLRPFENEQGNVLLRLRPDILAACWALVRHWDRKGRPKPSRNDVPFKHWAAIIGGIVEAAGFACPFKPSASAPLDQTTASMRLLVMEMEDKREYTFKELIEKCRKLEIFTQLVTDTNYLDKLSPKSTSALSSIFSRYNNRRVGDSRFVITGQFHARRYGKIKIQDLTKGDFARTPTAPQPLQKKGGNMHLRKMPDRGRPGG